MAYTPQTWTNGVSPVNASRMNHIEAGIELLDNGKLDVTEAASTYVSVGETHVDVAAYADDLGAALTAGPTAGVYHLNKPLYEPTATLTLNAGTVLEGAGSKATTIKLPDGANRDVIKTAGFDGLTGTNKWLVSEGLVTGFAVRGLTIDGNRANNTSGRGLAIYGKRFVVDDVVIKDTAGDGLYTEAGTGSGQSVVDDMPEASITRVWIYKAGGVGLRYRGPHDGYLDAVYVSQADDDCVRFESSGTYQGAADVGFMHAYASQTGMGFYGGAQVHVEHLITESNYEQGAVLAALGIRIGMLSLFGNWLQYASKSPYAPQANAHLHITGQDILIGQTRIEAYNGGTAAYVAGANAKFGQASLLGNGSTGMGLAVDESFLQGRFDVRGFSGTGGVGVKHGLTTGRAYCQYDAEISDCATLLTFGFQGIKNQLRFSLLANAGQVAHDGSAFVGTNNMIQIASSGAGSGLLDRFEVGADIYRGGNKVLGARDTGWTAGTGGANKGAFNSDTVTTPGQVAYRVQALENAMRAHGLIN